MMRLISERYNRLIVIVSRAFLKSPLLHQFFVDFAHAQEIEQQRRKIIPCLYENCTLPPSLSFLFHLKYYQSGRLYNFWYKLGDSIRSTNIPPAIKSPRMEISEIMDSTRSFQIKSSDAPTSETMPIKKPRKKGTKVASVDPVPEPKIRSAFSMIQLNAQSKNEAAPNGASLGLANCDMTHSETNLSEITKPKTSRNKSRWLMNLLPSSNGKVKATPVHVTVSSTNSCESKKKIKSKNWLKKKLTSSCTT